MEANGAPATAYGIWSYLTTFKKLHIEPTELDNQLHIEPTEVSRSSLKAAPPRLHYNNNVWM